MSRYTIERRGGCVLVTGAIPVTDFVAIGSMAGPGAVIDSDLAAVAGVTFAFGPPDACATLRKQLEPQALERERAAHPTLSVAATRWLATGERGISSNTMFTHLTGVDAMRNSLKSHPYDVADFRRCRLLLEQVPDLQPLSRMAELSPEWKALVQDWGDICASLDAEIPDWRDRRGGAAPKTYDLIKQAIGR